MAASNRLEFANETEIRWCPGCGDYAILAALQRILPTLGLPPEKHVFVSGIGCAGRLPYYMNAYGFHTIHGRATAVATGLKAMRDDLTVWVITGDGDALSIGGNHLIHCLRRNVNVNILLFNNQVYGLTKGQFSPTSQVGQVTKTTPFGLRQEPLNPLLLALASQASFVARGIDKDPQHLGQLFKQAHEHQGTAFIEIYQDCHIFNPGAFDAFSTKTNRATETIYLEEGEPFLFGKDKEWALVWDGEESGRVHAQTVQEVSCHDSTRLFSAMRLAKLSHPKDPVPLGIFYRENRETLQFHSKITKNLEDLAQLYRAKASWQQKS